MRVRYVIIAALLALVPEASQAQTPVTGEVSAGVKAGLNLTNISESEVGSTSNLTAAYDSRVGLILGGFVRRSFGAVSLQPEFLFTQQGASADQGQYKARINYLQIPVLASMTFEKPDFNTFFAVGPALSLKLSGKAIDDNVAVDLKEVGSDFGLVIGGGIEVERITAELRFTLGLKDINSDKTYSDKTRSLSLMIGYRFK